MDQVNIAFLNVATRVQTEDMLSILKFSPNHGHATEKPG